MARRTEAETKRLAREALAESADPTKVKLISAERDLLAAQTAIASAISAIEDGRRGDALRILKATKKPGPVRTERGHSEGGAA